MLSILTAFGLGTVIYDGLEFGAFLETPQDSPCFSILKGVNPILHATFAFFQMYFIFISARVIHFKMEIIAYRIHFVISRFIE